MRIHLRGFTLIELMVSITIFFIMSLATYVSYSHFHKKSLLNQGVKEITKTLYEARNLSINGVDFGSGNLSIGAYFDTTLLESQNKVQFFSYPYTFSGSQIIPEETQSITLYKEIKLPDGVTVLTLGGEKKFLLYFASPGGQGTYYSWSDAGVKTQFQENILPIVVAYKNADSPSLQREIKYYTEGYIADY